MSRFSKRWEDFVYDVKFRNGLIVDGAGSPGYVGDVGVRAGRVVAVKDAPDEARREIDCTGLVICPGFIDVHTHYDVQLFWDRMLSPSPWHGVTTVVMGNCGFALAPAKAEDRHFLLETLQHVEGIPFSASWPATGNGEWGFETFPEWLDLIERKGVAVNVASLIGHTAVRTWVMGPDDARSTRTPTDAELTEMCRIVREALEAGAAGFSTTSTPAHFGAGGAPVPSRWAQEGEHLALARTIAEVGRGRWQGTFGTVLTPEFLLDVLDKTGVAMCEITPGGFTRPDIYDALADQGYETYGQMGIVPNVIYTGLHEPFMFALDQPGGVYMIETAGELFNPIMDLPTVEERLAAYKDPSFLPKFIETTDIPSWNEVYWPDIKVAIAPTRLEWEGRRIVDIAEEVGRKPAEILWEISVDSNLAARINIRGGGRDMLQMLSVQDRVLPGLHDAGAHLAQIAESRWPTNLLGSYVRERGLPLERAIRLATSASARAYGIVDRGILSPGWWADVLVFNPETVIDGPIREAADLPGGATRLISEPTGVEYVMVNGTIIREQGKDAVDAEGDLPGRILREFAPHNGKKGSIPQWVFDAVHEMTEARIKAQAERAAATGSELPTDPAQPGRVVSF
jgi:N-acyl-D-amino-acid deacylase